MSSQVILYDLPSRQGTAWSLNPWKTRMVLNYKNINYKTEWVEYPDLEPKFKSFGIPPNDPNGPGYFSPYSSPAIKYADGSYGMDSWLIVNELEKRYPSPSLHLDDPIVIRVRDSMAGLMVPIIGHFIPKVPVVFLNPASAEYFYTTRKERFGKSLQEMEKDSATEQAWKDAEGPAKEFGELLRKNGGPYFLGETVSYADFIFVGFLQMLKRMGLGLFERFVGLDEAFPKVFEACAKWLEKED